MGPKKNPGTILFPSKVSVLKHKTPKGYVLIDMQILREFFIGFFFVITQILKQKDQTTFHQTPKAVART